MEYEFVDELIQAISTWGEITKQDPENIVSYAVMHIGAPWFIQAEGEVDDPDDPIHRGKKLKDVHGHYTLLQLQKYLIDLIEEQKILETFLVIGLCRSIEYELLILVDNYEDGLKRTVAEAQKFQDIVDNPEKHQKILSLYETRLRKHFGEEEPVDPVQSVTRLANMFWKFSHRSEDEPHQRKSWLDAWRKTTTPLITSENVHKHTIKYFGTLLE